MAWDSAIIFFFMIWRPFQTFTNHQMYIENIFPTGLFYAANSDSKCQGHIQTDD